MAGSFLANAGSAHGALAFGDFENEGYARGFTCIAGLDEAGRGPLAGPVVAAAVVLPRDFSVPGIRDSKLLSATRREQLARAIRFHAETWGLGIVGVEEIDRINILAASLLAMAKAYEALRPAPDCLLIDGNQKIPHGFLQPRRVSVMVPPYQNCIVKGDRVCISIAAASILAKVARDEIMVALDKTYPEYGFAAHKGYGSSAHLEALRRFGPSPIHRRSFKPVRDAAARVRPATSQD